MSQRPDQIRSDAADVLRDVLRWRLVPDRWGKIWAILETLGTGLDLADPRGLAALARASAALELAGPELLTEIEAAATSAPDNVRERASTLILELTRPRWNDGDDTFGAAG